MEVLVADISRVAVQRALITSTKHNLITSSLDL